MQAVPWQGLAWEALTLALLLPSLLPAPQPLAGGSEPVGPMPGPAALDVPQSSRSYAEVTGVVQPGVKATGSGPVGALALVTGMAPCEREAASHKEEGSVPAGILSAVPNCLGAQNGQRPAPDSAQLGSRPDVFALWVRAADLTSNSWACFLTLRVGMRDFWHLSG